MSLNDGGKLETEKCFNSLVKLLGAGTNYDVSPHNALQCRDSVCTIISVSRGRKREIQIHTEEAVGMTSGASGKWQCTELPLQILDGSWHFV